jgi:hypothetical protein
MPTAAYATSKVAEYWLVKQINEEEKLVAFVISSGWARLAWATPVQALMTVEEFCTSMLQLVDGATKESHGEKMWGHNVEKTY